MLPMIRSLARLMVVVVLLAYQAGMASAQSHEDRQIRSEIEKALRSTEDEFCSEVQVTDCRADFRKSIKYKIITISPNGMSGLFVETPVTGFCGSGGCSIYVLRKTQKGYKCLLETIGALEDLELSHIATNGFYDVLQHGIYNSVQRNRRYVWTGSRYKLTTSQSGKKK
jgi:hypothetical protein